MKKIILSLLAVTLLLIYLLLISSALIGGEEAENLGNRIHSMVVDDVPGWKWEDLPLGQTEERIARVNELLDFDDYVSRIYSRGNTQVVVYVAYWKPGGVPIADVQRHTPDVCWVRNGWKRIEEKSGIDLRYLTPNGEFAQIANTEFRVFEKDGRSQSVFFWHFVGDKVFFNPSQKESDGRIHRIINAFVALGKFGLDQKREQIFFRISSNQRIDEIVNTSAFLNL